MSSEKKLLVIIGITGQQGGSVADVFLASPLSSTWRLRGITRNPSKPSNAHLLSAGVELVAADLDDPKSLEKAFYGADAIFSVTDFWQFVQSPDAPAHALAAKRGTTPNIVAMELEIQQGENIVDAAAAAHAQKPLHRFVVSTLADSKARSNGEITHNTHFDGKDHYCQYLKSAYPALASVTSYLHVGFYLSNAFSFPFWAPRKDPSNSDTYVLPTSGAPNGHPLPFVNPPKDVGYFVEALINRAPAETIMLGCCNLMTFSEYTALWTRILGVKAKVEHITYEDVKAAGLPEWMALEVSESGKFVSKYGWTGGEPGVKSPEECGVDVSKLTSVEEWIRQQDWNL